MFMLYYFLENVYHNDTVECFLIGKKMSQMVCLHFFVSNITSQNRKVIIFPQTKLGQKQRSWGSAWY